MKLKFTILFCFVVLLSCENSGDNIVAGVDQSLEGTEEVKRERAVRAAQRGNVTDLANGYMEVPGRDEPCRFCLDNSPRRRYAHFKSGTQTVAEFGDPNCLAVGERSAVSNSGVVFSGNQSEKQYLADVIATLNEMAGEEKAKSLLRGVRVQFKNTVTGASGCIPGSQLSGSVEVGRACNGQSFSEQAKVATLIHEMGHDMAGNNGLRAGYYREIPASSTRERCQVSGYCTHRSSGPVSSRSEEFSEAFAAYFLAPDKLKRARGCRKAYDYFNRVLNRGKSRTCR